MQIRINLQTIDEINKKRVPTKGHEFCEFDFLFDFNNHLKCLLVSLNTHVNNFKTWYSF